MCQKVRSRQISAGARRGKKLQCKTTQDAKKEPDTSCRIHCCWHTPDAVTQSAASFALLYWPALCWKSAWWHNKNWSWHFLHKSIDATEQGKGGSRQWAHMTGWRCSGGLQKKTKLLKWCITEQPCPHNQQWYLGCVQWGRGTCQHTLLSNNLSQFALILSWLTCIRNPLYFALK